MYGLTVYTMSYTMEKDRKDLEESNAQWDGSDNDALKELLLSNNTKLERATLNDKPAILELRETEYGKPTEVALERMDIYI